MPVGYVDYKGYKSLLLQSWFSMKFDTKMSNFNFSIFFSSKKEMFVSSLRIGCYFKLRLLVFFALNNVFLCVLILYEK